MSNINSIVKIYESSRAENLGNQRKLSPVSKRSNIVAYADLSDICETMDYSEHYEEPDDSEIDDIIKDFNNDIFNVSLNPRQELDNYSKCIEEFSDFDLDNDVITDEYIYGAAIAVGMVTDTSNEKIEEAKKQLEAAKECYRTRTQYEVAMEMLCENDYRCLENPCNNDSIFKYDGTCWRHIDDHNLKMEIYNFIDEKMKDETPSIEAFCSNVSNFIKYATWQRYFNRDGVFGDDDYRKTENRIVFQNSVYDLLNKKERKHNKELPYMSVVNCNYIPYDEETPYYDTFKKSATGDDRESMDMIDYMLADLLLPNRSAKSFFVMSYAKDSGKSMFGNFIERLIGIEHCQTMDPDNFGRFSFANAEGTLLYSCLEMDTAKLNRKSVANFKSITGNKRIRVEAKFKNEKTIMIRFKLLFASNGGFYLPDGMEDEAFYRRLIVIPFVKSTPRDRLDSDLLDKLWNERDAIVSKAVRKYSKFVKSGEAINFPQSSLSLEIKKNWMGEQLIEKRFVHQELEYTGNPEHILSKDEIYNRYISFFEDKMKLMDSPTMMCTKKQLIDAVRLAYPRVESKKHRLRNKDNPNGDAIPCIVGIKWYAQTKPMSQHSDDNQMVVEVVRKHNKK